MTTLHSSGGFLPPSPPASTASFPSILPHPRSTPLKPSSQKEAHFIQYVDDKLFAVSGRFERRHATTLDGYMSFAPIASDLSAVIDIVWVSGTPGLQIPYLLNIALAAVRYLEPYAFAPRETFSLLEKLDEAFAGLLRGRDVGTGQRLPGCDGRGALTATQKVRLRGVVEGTRVAVGRIAEKGEVDRESGIEEVEETDDEDGMVTEVETEDEGITSGAESRFGTDGTEEDMRGLGGWDVEISRVYEKTLVDLQTGLDEGPGRTLI